MSEKTSQTNDGLSIKSLSLSQLQELITELGQPKYRAEQVYDWIHTHNVSSYDEMSNVPKALREALSDRFPMKSSQIFEAHHSKDGSVKYLIEFSDGIVAEAVAIVDGEIECSDASDCVDGGDGVDGGNTGDSDSGMKDFYSDVDFDERDTGSSTPGRITVCVSSQAGCAMECAFCATGKQGFVRDLSADEIVDQVVLVGRDLKSRISNVVLMGQGEPFLNYRAVIEAMKRLNHDKGLEIGARHITVSTSGILDGIYDFTDEPEQFRLAISLHSADQKTRNELMPRLSGQPLHALKKALSYYCDVKGRRVTIEYLLLDGVNDSDEQLNKLIEFCRGLNAHVNILEFNSVPGAKIYGESERTLQPSSKQRVSEWLSAIQNAGINASLRRSKGQDVAGSCGQLANSHI